jgi:hypothetical protein
MASSDERKCLRCEFSAPVSDWKIWPEGHCNNRLCFECRCMYCKTCKFGDGRVRQWRYEEDGVPGFRCPKCTHPDLRKCGREFCSFWAPPKDWKINAKGETSKWCEHCLDVSRKKGERVKERKKEQLNGTFVPIEYGEWEGKLWANKKYEDFCDKLATSCDIEERKEVGRAKLYIKCPGCNKELLKTSLSRHQAKSCKELVVAPLVESVIASVD